MRSRAVLPNVERRLTALAKKRAAEAKRRRSRGPGFAIIIFAGLALAGTALAATGVWNPLSGDHHRAQPTRSGGVVEVQNGFDRGVPGPAAGLKGRQQRPGESDRGLGATTTATTPAQVVAPVFDQGGGGDTGQGPATNGGPAPNVAGIPGPSSVGGANPTNPGKSNGGNGPQVDPPGQSGGNPGPGSSAPRPTRISVFCGLEPEVEGTAHCRVTVDGEAGAPTGQVSFESTGSGRFSANSCGLSDDGNGTTSSCDVDYTPAVRGAGESAVASYGGDTANAPSSSNFVT